MSQNLEYKWLPGPVGQMLKSSSLATTVTVPLTGKLVVTTGHVGVDLKTGRCVTDSLRAECDAVLDCLDTALRNAGVAAGLAEAHKIMAFFVEAECETVMLSAFRERYPGHSPAWTSVVVASIIVPGMHAEVQAEAMVYG